MFFCVNIPTKKKEHKINQLPFLEPLFIKKMRPTYVERIVTVLY
jgi:hypothetical protein